MGIFHFLNVKHGDCSIIQHPSSHVTVVDVCNARRNTFDDRMVQLRKALAGVDASLGRVPGNFNQKDYPVNPILYMKDRGIDSIFRFILTHPDMDHMDGIKDLFAEFGPLNFWDTANTCEKDDFGNGPYREEDWLFYKWLRDENREGGPRRLTLHAGDRAKYFNRQEDGSGGGDGLYVLAPTKELMADCRDRDDYNDGSYVILYRSNAGRILMAGDSHDGTWDHILANHAEEVADVELLIAPHHGRDSGRSYDFLNVVRPKLTFFGNANSEHLAYGAWSRRGLPIITNNQADCMVVDTNGSHMQVYVTNGSFALARNPAATYFEAYRAWYLGYIDSGNRAAA